jgi:hypothetical protein
MLGNKLLQVLKDLNTSERKLLIYRAKRSEDKRLKQFIRLLGEPNQSSAEFQESLMIVKNNISSKGQTEKIKNDQLRRFIDFCIKEIEDLKIENYSKSHPAIRNYILSDVYNKINTRYIYQDYLLKLNFSTKNSNDFWIKNYYINKMSSLKLLSQTDDDFKEWRTLLATQIKLVQDYYNEEIANVYAKIGASYVDDKTTLEQFDAKYLNQDFILKHIELAQSHKVKANLFLALARFNIEDEIKYPLYSSEAIRIIKNIHDDEADIIRRRVFFASFLHVFHFNHPYPVIKKLLLKIIAFNEKIQFEEPKIFFYLFLLQILKDDTEGTINVYNINSKKYFTDPEFLYFFNFLEALEYYKREDFKSAKRILSNLSFINNPYIASWSRCIEVAINYKQGDMDLTESLVIKELKRLSLNSNRIFTINSSIVFMVTIAKILNVKVSKSIMEMSSKTIKISPIHEFILNSIKNK